MFLPSVVFLVRGKSECARAREGYIGRGKTRAENSSQQKASSREVITIVYIGKYFYITNRDFTLKNPVFVSIKILTYRLS